MRNTVLCYINGERHEIAGEQAFMTVANYLRYIKNLRGTKIVCSEGDCGACSILVSRFKDGKLTKYQSINSCISFMYLLDRCHIVTVEGLKCDGEMNQVQEKMLACHGAQCGYCTPGFICALTNMAEDLKLSGKENTEQKVKNYLTGNLCRCTGYQPIIDAGKDINLANWTLLSSEYNHQTIENDFIHNASENLILAEDKQEILAPNNLSDACELKAKTSAMITSGATDLGVQINKGRTQVEKTLSLNNIDELYAIKVDDKEVKVGAKASLDDVEKAFVADFPEASRMLHIFASPQIKNTGTLVGNIINASPISDTTPFLMVADAIIELANQNNQRSVNINDFFKEGYKNLDLKAEELVTSIRIPKLGFDFKLYKISIRKDLDISTVTFAAAYKLDDGKLEDIKLAFGGVGPKVLRMPKLEGHAKGKTLDMKLITDLTKMVDSEITPLSDLRGTKEYRYRLIKNLLHKFHDEIVSQGQEANI